MRTEAVVSLKLPSRRKLKSLIDALSPELKKTAESRATANLSCKGNLLLLRVEAENTIMLRSTLNAYLHWVNSATTVIELMGDSS